MIVVRAWPDHPPPARARVDDLWPRTAVDDYNYASLADLGDDVIVVDWDTAVSLEDLRVLAAYAQEDPARPLVAPCRMYLPQPVWNCRRYEAAGRGLRYVTEEDETCHLFGFGMTYLPHALIARFLAENPGCRMDDTSFSGWYHRVTGAETVIAWDVRPVHLHYEVPAGGRL